MTGQEVEFSEKMPKALEAVFAGEKSLSSYVEEECKKRNIEHEAVSKEMEDMKMKPEPEVDFHEELKFSVKPSLATSKKAYQVLLGGLAHGDFNEYCSIGLVPYQGEKHHSNTANPLHFFDYNALIDDWMTTTDPQEQAKSDQENK